MPYLRLYSPHLPLEQKQVIGQKLIDITLRAFRLRPEQRYRTSVQFITRCQTRPAENPRLDIASNADFTLEVIGHNLTEREKKAFAEEAAAMINKVVPRSLPQRIASLLGIRSDSNQRVVFQFSELSPAVSDPFLVHTEHRAA